MLLMHDAASTEFMGFFHVHVFKWWLQQGECHLPVAADLMNYLEAGGNGIRATGLSNDRRREMPRCIINIQLLTFDRVGNNPGSTQMSETADSFNGFIL